MNKKNTLPANVIPVDFTAKKAPAISGEKIPASNPFADFIDDNNMDIEKFTQALLISKEDKILDHNNFCSILK